MSKLSEDKGLVNLISSNIEEFATDIYLIGDRENNIFPKYQDALDFTLEGLVPILEDIDSDLAIAILNTINSGRAIELAIGIKVRWGY